VWLKDTICHGYLLLEVFGDRKEGSSRARVRVDEVGEPMSRSREERVAEKTRVVYCASQISEGDVLTAVEFAVCIIAGIVCS
jgi:hypothetical protein